MQKVGWQQVDGLEVDKRMFATKWMVDEDVWPQLVTLQQYKQMLQNQFWSKVQNQSSHWQFWFMQDGATKQPHKQF